MTANDLVYLDSLFESFTGATTIPTSFAPIHHTPNRRISVFAVDNLHWGSTLYPMFTAVVGASWVGAVVISGPTIYTVLVEVLLFFFALYTQSHTFP